MTIRRTAAVAATFTLALGGTLAATSTPAAAAPPANCANNSVCGYAAPNYATVDGYEFVTGSAGSCQNVGLGNKWTSVFNNTGRQIRLYKNINCGNGVWSLPNGDGLSHMALYQPSWNDNIESVRLS